MSARRLARLSQNVITGAQSTNWTTQATETYNSALPADSPSSWGTDPEIANLDRDLDKTGSLKQHLGILLTITAGPDVFWGAIVKLQITYGNTDDPQLEMWTHDTPNGWVKRRKLDVNTLARTGDTVIYDLVLASPFGGIDQVWITLVPTSTETNNWVVSHLYGDCTAILLPQDCPPLSNPADCGLDWPQLPGDGPDEPTLEDPPDIPTDFPLPPVLVQVANPPTYTGLASTFSLAPNNSIRAYLPPGPGRKEWTIPCPGALVIRMYFSIRAGGAVTVEPVNNYIITFNEGSSQTVTGDNFIDWTVVNGFTPANPHSPGRKYLFPAAIHPFVTFSFTPHLDFSVLDFFDWEQFLWTYEIMWNTEIC